MLGPHQKKTLCDFLEELLSCRNFQAERAVGGEKMVVPLWSHCLDYEFQLRKQAIKLHRTQGFSIQRALWSAYNDEHHRMKHWVTLLSTANSSSDAAITKLQNQVEALLREKQATDV